MLNVFRIHEKNGEFIPSELVLIDFDNVGYGFRIFDLIYFMSNWGYFPPDNDVKVYLKSKFRLKRIASSGWLFQPNSTWSSI